MFLKVIKLGLRFTGSFLIGAIATTLLCLLITVVIFTLSMVNNQPFLFSIGSLRFLQISASDGFGLEFGPGILLLILGFGLLNAIALETLRRQAEGSS